MSTVTGVTVASSARDAEAAQAVVRHHAELAGRLATHVERMLAAAPDGEGFAAARRDTAAFCATELVPHALAEEQTLYPAAAASTEARLLVESMLAQHEVITSLAGQLAGESDSASDAVRAAAAAHALRVVFDAHLAAENDVVLPLLAADPQVSLADLLAGMHELLGGDEEPADAGHGGCGCGGSDSGVPELDVRAVPHAIRHATVFGAFDAVPPGGSLVLVAPHDPLPLLEQLRARTGGRLAVSYDERGPQAWRLRLTRA